MKGASAPSTYCWGTKTLIERENGMGGVKSDPVKILLIADVIVKLTENPAGAPAFNVRSGEFV
jgi:hypothetical protein